MRARLTLETGDSTPPSIELLPDQPATVGRGKDNSLIIRDDLASRMHMKVYFEDGRWVVRDFGLNGTKVAGHRVSGSAALNDGALIQIGDTRLRFALVTSNEPATKLTAVAIAAKFSSAVNSNLTVTPPPRRTVSDFSHDARKNGSHSSASIRNEARNGKGVDRRTPSDNGTRIVPGSEAFGPEVSSRLKVDELTALCRYMTGAMETSDPHDLIRATLRAIVHQTAARLAGYLSLDPNDSTPRFVLPEQSNLDVPLSRHLTDRVRSGRRLVWLHHDSGSSNKLPTESLQAFRDAICLPLSANGETYAALHVYRTGAAFDERDVRYVEAVGGYLARALELHRHRRVLEAENQRLRASVPTADELIGDSTAMMSLRQLIARAAPQPFTVLIQGDSGAGKELVAQALHRGSLRAGGPLVVVNCAAIAPTLLEAELFGYRKGAFSGADRDHPGLFEQADDGTLFLDEVGELTLECQAKLLRIIEGKPFRAVGGISETKVDVRVIAATNKDLDKEVKAGHFRQDLLFRLKVIPLLVPPLRDHAEDVPELAHFFLERLSVQCRRPFKLTIGAIRKLQGYSWPGNVRQLRAVLETAAVMCEADTIDAHDIPLAGAVEPPPMTDLPPSLDMDELETWAIRRALKQTVGNVSRAAQVLGMSRDTLHTKLKKKAIDRTELLAAEA